MHFSLFPSFPEGSPILCPTSTNQNNPTTPTNNTAPSNTSTHNYVTLQSIHSPNSPIEMQSTTFNTPFTKLSQLLDVINRVKSVFEMVLIVHILFPHSPQNNIPTFFCHLLPPSAGNPQPQFTLPFIIIYIRMIDQSSRLAYFSKHSDKILDCQIYSLSVFNNSLQTPSIKFIQHSYITKKRN